MEDHHLEVIALFRENDFHGLVAYDSDYALSNISHYFSSHALKLSRNGKSITTSQYLLQDVAKQFDMKPSFFAVFAALLGWCDSTGHSTHRTFLSKTSFACLFV